jgi:hypothetical protein
VNSANNFNCGRPPKECQALIHQPVALSWRQRRALSLIAVKELLPESYARPCERAGPKTTAGIAACKPNWSSTFTISDPPLRPQITSSQRS